MNVTSLTLVKFLVDNKEKFLEEMTIQTSGILQTQFYSKVRNKCKNFTKIC